jgi:hypothetical protein
MDTDGHNVRGASLQRLSLTSLGRPNRRACGAVACWMLDWAGLKWGRGSGGAPTAPGAPRPTQRRGKQQPSTCPAACEARTRMARRSHALFGSARQLPVSSNLRACHHRNAPPLLTSSRVSDILSVDEPLVFAHCSCIASCDRELNAPSNVQQVTTITLCPLPEGAMCTPTTRILLRSAPPRAVW